MSFVADISHNIVMSWDKQRVQQLRKKLGLTQTEFSKVLGCRQQTVSEWELGLYAPANAYGKLLRQLEEQTHLNFQTRPIQYEESLSAPYVAKFESEFLFDKSFDPAID